LRNRQTPIKTVTDENEIEAETELPIEVPIIKLNDGPLPTVANVKASVANPAVQIIIDEEIHEENNTMTAGLTTTPIARL
jgi:hypothetical protein